MSSPSFRFAQASFTVLAALVVGPVAGCAAPRDPWFDHMVESGRVDPADDVERLALERMEALPLDAPVAIEGRAVVAGERYVAASGRICRPLRIEGSSATLACREPGSAEEDEGRSPWFLAPDVFGPAPVAVDTAAAADATGEGEGAP